MGLEDSANRELSLCVPYKYFRLQPLSDIRQTELRRRFWLRGDILREILQNLS